MTEDIDSIVKGAPATPTNLKSTPGSSPVVAASGKQGDPLNHAPSSPAMVYLNLLILEASLRAQFLELRARKRHHTFFLTLLTLWVAFFGYKLYFAPREDGRGVGGSIYWALEGAQKVCFMGGIITAILVWGTGIWDRGIRWPRRWFAISNRGLRGFNCKLVIIRRPWWAEALSTIGFFLTYGLLSHTASSSYRHVEPALLRETEKELQMAGDGHPMLVLPHDEEDRGGHEEDLAPGGDYVKLLLLPKPFSPTFRENWELYRTEYWERENERRALLRQKVKEHDRRATKQTYGWLWWLPWRQVPQRKLNAGNKSFHRHSGSEKVRRHRSNSNRRLSVSSSRSQTPALEIDDGQITRRPSSASDKRRKKQSSMSMSKSKRSGTESRSVTPEAPSPLTKEATVKSDDSAHAEGSRRVLRSAGQKSARGSPEADMGS
ncbi:Nem1-Spo7 phosphatase regulatory subunit [Conoideocrella luteorostrata]|uniref:Nem1-Spo7 phosphatase regulatory subunit n=1 Tax=Conoideocrella luteorostrata TaxID=1105319 RepID=A0AAJ0FMT1_9HYPO|nr:Nem1-Spo7 phosphatase regulatory subunit [Conoideocrella luteorostrata]